jgi:hypothetical protein
MEAAVLASAGNLAHIIGASLMSHSIHQLFNVLQHLDSEEYISTQLEELDIVALLQTVEALVKDISEETCFTDAAVGIALKNIIEIIDKIHQLLLNITEERNAHQQRWFAAWRTPQYTAKLEKLGVYKGILDDRVDLLIKILSIQRKKASLDTEMQSGHESHASNNTANSNSHNHSKTGFSLKSSLLTSLYSKPKKTTQKDTNQPSPTIAINAETTLTEETSSVSASSSSSSTSSLFPLGGAPQSNLSASRALPAVAPQQPPPKEGKEKFVFI